MESLPNRQTKEELQAGTDDEFEAGDFLFNLVLSGAVAALIATGIYETGVINSWATAQPNFMHGFYLIVAGCALLVVRMVADTLTRL